MAWQTQREKQRSCLQRQAADKVVSGHLWAQHPPSAGGQTQVNLCDHLFPLSFESRMPNHGQNQVRAAAANYAAPQVISD